jgi:hypothetical protein
MGNADLNGQKLCVHVGIGVGGPAQRTGGRHQSGKGGGESSQASRCHIKAGSQLPKAEEENPVQASRTLQTRFIGHQLHVGNVSEFVITSAPTLPARTSAQPRKGGAVV